MDDEDVTDESDPRGDRVTVFADEGHGGQRLDRFLAEQVDGLSRSRLQALIRSGSVLAQGRLVQDPKHKVRVGETFDVLVPPPEPAVPAGERMALDIVHEDADLIVLNKPAGLVVHPSAGHETGTLVNGLIDHCGDELSGIGGVKRPGIVHRLDKDTTGLLVVAKTDRAHQGLSAQFASHGADGRMHRAYVAVCWGRPLHQSGRIEAPLGRNQSNRLKMAVVSETRGRFAATGFEVLSTLGAPTMRKASAGKPSVALRHVSGTTSASGVATPGEPLACEMRLVLETGRTHQIRVHLAHIGHPVIGDPLYAVGFRSRSRRFEGEVADALDQTARQMLHAGELGFEHPASGKELSFSCAPPADYLGLKDILNKS